MSRKSARHPDRCLSEATESQEERGEERSPASRWLKRVRSAFRSTPESGYMERPTSSRVSGKRGRKQPVFYYLEESMRVTNGLCSNTREVAHRFSWVPKGRYRRLLPQTRVTVAEYSYLISNVYDDEGQDIPFEEFEPLIKLVEMFGEESEGLPWEEAVALTKAAEERADAITYQLDGLRPTDMYLRQGMIRTPGARKATYPRTWFD